MATCNELKEITKARLKTVNILVGAKDWDGAVYMMGYALEVALKATICKTLNLNEYPDKTGSDKINTFFKTHDFDRLLKVSGMENVFSLSSGFPAEYQHWSEFTKEFPGEQWTEMRYALGRWDEAKAKGLFNNLIESKTGIITYIKRKRKW